MTPEIPPQRRVPPPTTLVMRHLREACEKHGVSEVAVLAGSRRRAAIEARHETVRAVYDSAPGRYAKIGIARRLGLDHTTVVRMLKPEAEREALREYHRQRAAARAAARRQ